MKLWDDSVSERFDSYMKKSLRRCLFRYQEKNKLIADIEILSDAEIGVCSLEEFDFFENRVRMLNFDMIIKNDLLYELLRSLEQYQRDIIYLSMCQNYSDREIGERLNMSRSAVQRMKVKLRTYLKEKLTGGVTNEE